MNWQGIPFPRFLPSPKILRPRCVERRPSAWQESGRTRIRPSRSLCACYPMRIRRSGQQCHRPLELRTRRRPGPPRPPTDGGRGGLPALRHGKAAIAYPNGRARPRRGSPSNTGKFHAHIGFKNPGAPVGSARYSPWPVSVVHPGNPAGLRQPVLQRTDIALLLHRTAAETPLRPDPFLLKFP